MIAYRDRMLEYIRLIQSDLDKLKRSIVESDDAILYETCDHITYLTGEIIAETFPTRG